MQWLNPDRIAGTAAKWFCYLLALLLLIPLGARLIGQMPFLGVALAVCLAGYIAHVLRNHKTSTRVRNIGGAERTPMMPIGEDGE